MKTTKTRQEQDTSPHLPRDSLGGGAVRRAELGRRGNGPEHAPATSPHTSCLWCHLLPPRLLSEWLSLKLPAHPVGHDQVSPALCPPWTCRLPQLPPPGILSRATSSQDDPASAGRPVLPRSLAAVANEGCGQPHQRQAARRHSPGDSRMFLASDGT